MGMTKDSQTKIDQIRDFINKATDDNSGATCQEVEDATGFSHSTCSARILDLMKRGDIHVFDKERNSKGNNVRIYAAGKGD